MSRQYDQYMEGKFEIYGEQYQIISPSNFDELMQAFQVRNALQTAISGLMHDEDSSGYDSLLQEQEDEIHAYLESIEEFDNRILIGNIGYLAKKHDLRIGEIENMLGLSAGYISRTAKENSSKKLSIDVVWKIARLFEVDIKTLLTEDLRVPTTNSDLVIKFIKKMQRETESGLIEWQDNGGCTSELDETLANSGLIFTEGESSFYRSMYLNREAKYILAGDIYACENISLSAEVLIVPFALAGKDVETATQYEFITRHCDEDESHPDSATYRFYRMFNTADDPFTPVNSAAKELYELICSKQFDTRVSPGAKDMILRYMKVGDCE